MRTTLASPWKDQWQIKRASVSVSAPLYSRSVGLWQITLTPPRFPPFFRISRHFLPISDRSQARFRHRNRNGKLFVRQAAEYGCNKLCLPRCPVWTFTWHESRDYKWKPRAVPGEHESSKASLKYSGQGRGNNWMPILSCTTAPPEVAAPHPSQSCF